MHKVDLKSMCVKKKKKKICVCVNAKSLQSCLTLFNPMDHNWPGSSIHGILRVRLLEWLALPSYRESFPPRD